MQFLQDDIWNMLSPKIDKPINKLNFEELKPHKIDEKPIPKNIMTIIDERLHLSLNHPNGIAPRPINKAPNDHNFINSSYEAFQFVSIVKINYKIKSSKHMHKCMPYRRKEKC